MSNVTSQTHVERRNAGMSVASPGQVALDERSFDPGEVVLVNDAGRSYYATVLGTTWNGSYIVDPVAVQPVDHRLAA